MKKQLLTLLFLAFSYGIFAQNINFPDAALKNALLNHNPAIDLNSDGEIQLSEANNFTDNIYIYSSGISDLMGLENFSSVVDIQISSSANQQNNLGTFNLADMPNLEKLFISYGGVTSFDLSGFTSLKEVNFFKNLDITNISSAMFPNSIEKISFRYNSINSCDLSSLTNLEELDLDSNPLGAFSANLLPSGIKYLSLSSTLITSVDLSTLNDLEILILSFNDLQGLDISNDLPHNLKNLRLHDCNLNNVNLSDLQSLEELNIASNNLVNIDLSSNLQLEYLGPVGNPLQEIDISNNPNLAWLDLWALEDLEYLNLKNGNNQNLILGEPFFEMGNLEFVCVDSVEYFFNNYYEEQIFGTPWFGVSTDCGFYPYQLNHIEGNVTYDAANNNCSSSSVNIPNLLVKSQIGTDEYASLTNENGAYVIGVADGGTTTEVASTLPSYYSIAPNNAPYSFTGYGNTVQLDFCISGNQTVNDMVIGIIPLTVARPGEESTYLIEVENQGTTTLSGTVDFSFDGTKQSFVSAVPMENSSTSNNVILDFNNLSPFQHTLFEVTLENFIPPTTNLGDLLDFTASINMADTDATPNNNTSEFEQTVTSSFDPNDKQVMEGEEIYLEEADEYLHYLIRFQNSGTANAQNIRITDTLSPNLDWNSIKIINSSHDHITKITNGNTVEFLFNDIDLPYESADAEGSNGYIAYKIKPKQAITVGEIMDGDAEIFFDYNLPIVTNMVTTTVIENLNNKEYELSSSISVYPNPTKGNLTINSNNYLKIEKVEFYSLTGQLLAEYSNTNSIDISNLSNGLYFIKIQDSKGQNTIKKVNKY